MAVERETNVVYKPLIFRWMVLVAIGCCCFLFFLDQGRAERVNAEAWTQDAERIHQLVKEKQWTEARETLAKLAAGYSRADFSGQDISLEAIHALSECLLDLEGKLNQVRPDPASILSSAVRLRLAFDALSHPNQPLWHGRYQDIIRKAEAVERAVKSGEGEEVRKAVAALDGEYRLIRPAVVVSKSPQTVEKVDSMMAYLRTQANLAEMDREALMDGVKRFKQMMDPLFYGSEKDVVSLGRSMEVPEVLPFLWVGGMIALVLAYVGWRMYRAEQVAVRAEGPVRSVGSTPFHR
jgi:sporulation protein YpjB